MTLTWHVPVGAATTSARIDGQTGERAAQVVILAHGAGGRLDDRGMETTARLLSEYGLAVVRFNFLYREEGRGRPDHMKRLQTCYAAVVDHVRRELAPATLIVGGRSMGGRVASMLAADGLACDGLLLLAYPLHPAGRPDELRDAHLARITQPVLCLNGTKDALCRRDLMEAALARANPPNWTMHWLAEADHSFHVLKSSGRTDKEVLAEVRSAVQAWLASVHRPAGENR